jgi:hypothetical protein
LSFGTDIYRHRLIGLDMGKRFFCRKEDLELAENLMPDKSIETISDEVWEAQIKDMDAVIIAGNKPGTPNAIVRLCMNCGATVYLQPYNKEANHIICVECAKGAGII